MKRRDFIATTASLVAASSVGGCKSAPPLAGEILGPDMALGHAFRDGAISGNNKNSKNSKSGNNVSNEVIDKPIVIIGGGIAGLSAAWALQRAGIHDFALLEMESSLGGNSRFSESAITAYPWGAHYIPLPTREAVEERALLADLGILTAGIDSDTPTYDERFLTHAPHERLFERGLWHDGLQPKATGDVRANNEIARFKAFTETLKSAKGNDGRRVFAIPIAYASRDPQWLALDRITMHDWLLANDYQSEALHWMVNYGCRDDYGTDYKHASAWAGLHYFACRAAGATNADSESVLTWPEGNGYVVKQLEKRLPKGAQVHAMATSVLPQQTHVLVHGFIPSQKTTITYRAQQVIWAAPLFIAQRAIQGLSPSWMQAFQGRSYAPWLTANLHVNELPLSRGDASIAWDNVLMQSPALGYVVATHQHLKSTRGASVLTYYMPLSDEPPKAARQRLVDTPWRSWADAIMLDLSFPHADIRNITTRLDVWRNAHAMTRPEPGVLWGGADGNIARDQLFKAPERIHFAHSDLSGLSLFEEANFHGVRAGQAVAKLMATKI